MVLIFLSFQLLLQNNNGLDRYNRYGNIKVMALTVAQDMEYKNTWLFSLQVSQVSGIIYK